MKFTFFVSKEFMNSEFARTAQPVPSSFTAIMEISPAQAARLLQFRPYGATDQVNVEKGEFVLKTHAGRSLGVNTFDGAEALEEVLAIFDKETREREEGKRADKIEAERREAQRIVDIKDTHERIVNNPAEAAKYFHLVVEPMYKSNLQHLGWDEETYKYVVAEKTRVKAEAAAKSEAEKAMLGAWVDEHGSELVQLRKEDGYNWVKMALEEWVMAHVPEGWALLEGDPDSRYKINNPSLNQIKALREIKKIDPKAELMRYVEGNDDSTEDDDDDSGKDMIDVIERTLIAPAGNHTAIIYYVTPA